MIEWGQKSKPTKNPLGFKQNPKKFLDQDLTPKKSHAEFPSHKNFQKALNDITRKIQKNPYLNKKVRAKIFQTQKNPSVIPVTYKPE